MKKVVIGFSWAKLSPVLLASFKERRPLAEAAEQHQRDFRRLFSP
jgi:hypothetical protein